MRTESEDRRMTYDLVALERELIRLQEKKSVQLAEEACSLAAFCLLEH
jgi:hypothetical protein